MILPDPGHEDIPIEINPRRLLPLSPYFKQLTAIVTVLILTVGLGLAVKLSQENQNPFKKAGGVPIIRVDLSVNKIDSTKYGLSAQAVGDSANEVSYQWGVSSTNSIGTLNIHSSNKYAEFTLNGNQGRADIWVAVDGGAKASYAIVSGAFVGAPNTCGGTCGSHSNCQAGLICYAGFCRNPQCKETKDCSCVVVNVTPTPPSKPIVKPTPEVAEYTPAPLSKPRTITENKIYDLDLEKPVPTPAPKPQSIFGKIIGFVLKLFGIRY